MDPRSQSSFIPKKPIVASARQSNSPMSFFSIIATVIFVLAILACAGVFFYQNYLTSQISSASGSLNRAQTEFDPSTLTELIRLDSRLSVSSQLLQKHVAVSNFFTELGKVTLQSVRFSDFNFTVGDKGALSITMKGEAEDFTSIALQSDALIKDTYFTNVMLSDFSVEQSGAVAFDATFDINPSLVSYSTPGTTQVSSVIPAPAALASSTTASSAASTTNFQTQ